MTASYSHGVQQRNDGLLEWTRRVNFWLMAPDSGGPLSQEGPRESGRRVNQKCLARMSSRLWEVPVSLLITYLSPSIEAGSWYLKYRVYFMFVVPRRYLYKFKSFKNVNHVIFQTYQNTQKIK